MRRLQDEQWFEEAGPPAGAASRALSLPSLEARLAREGERRFLFAPVCVGGGIVTFFGLGHDPSLVGLALALSVAAAAVWLLRPGSLSRHLAGAGLFFLLGMLAATLRIVAVDAPVVPEGLGPMVVEGIVARLEEDAEKGDRVTLAVLSVSGLGEAETPRRATLRSRIDGADYAIGSKVRVRAVLLPPPDAARPGGFDYARQAFFLGIGATGYAVARPERLAGGATGLLSRAQLRIERLRGEIGGRIRATMSPVAGAIGTALVTGQRSYIPEESEEALRAAGLAHILAISGLHMMLVVGTIFAAIRYGAALVPQIALTWPVKKWAALLALLGGTAYLLISGWSIATQRAYIMAAVLLVAVMADRPAITMRNVALAALVILLLRPEAAVTAGFQMSFAATTALVAAYERLRLRERRPAPRGQRPHGFTGTLVRYAGGLLLTSFVAGAATAPFAAYHFHRVATYGLLANLLAMPVFGFVVMPAALVGMLLMPFGLEGPALWLMGQGIETILWVAGHVAALDGAVRIIPAFPPVAIGLISFGALWLGLWRTGWRSLGVVIAATGVLLAVAAQAPDFYVSRSGRSVALREGDTVTIIGRRSSDYEREQWLAAWGRPAEEETARSICDGLACYHAGEKLAASVVAEPDAFAEDCGLAELVVARSEPPSWCGETALVLAPADLETSGTIAGTIATSADGSRSIRLVTASGETGARPWNWRWRAHGPPTLPREWRPPQ